MRGDAVALARLRIEGLGRALGRRLVDAGLGDLEVIRGADREAVRRTLNHAGAFRALEARLDGVVLPPKAYRPTASAPALRVAEPAGCVESVSTAVASASSAIAEVSPAIADPAPQAPPPPVAPAVAPANTPALVVDLREVAVTYRGHAIPTRPPGHLQRQPLLALAALAARAGQLVSMTELATGMHELGGPRRRPIAPEARDVRYRLLRVFRTALEGKVPRAEIDRLIESVPHAGLRLNVDGPVRVVGAMAEAAE